MSKLYTVAPDGYCGEENNGKTSVWSVFSELGLYSVCLSSDQYIVRPPLFNKVKVTLEKGNRFEINAPNSHSLRRDTFLT